MGQEVKHTFVAANGVENKQTEVFPVKKKWGVEYTATNTPKYCAKVMVLNTGAKCSLHTHKLKVETFILVSGTLIVETINTSTGKTVITELKNVGDNITLSQYVPHTFYCPKNQIGPTVFVEASTQDYAWDSYRFTESTGPSVPQEPPALLVIDPWDLKVGDKFKVGNDPNIYTARHIGDTTITTSDLHDYVISFSFIGQTFFLVETAR